MKYKIFGNYGLESEQLLEECSSRDEAIQWAKGYTRWGNLGGYEAIEVISFATNGEAVTHWRLLRDED
ncbi:MAG: hypothetical protein IT536_04435 [Hyphomicrobiales bacterium]|nr:hypothetical protein [Hyphomicrobiales bacterium]